MTASIHKWAYFLCVCVVVMMLPGCKGKIQGQIIDNFGQPVAGVSIGIENSGYQTTSNAKGAFRLEYAPGLFKLVLNKDGYVGFQQELNLADDSGYKMGEVRMVRYQTLRGVAVDNFGVPLANATAEVIDLGKTAQSQADGKFEIAGLAGNHSLKIVLDGYLARVNELVIPEQEEAEIGNVVAVRLPRQSGVLYQGAEDYSQVQEIALLRKDKVIQEEIGLLSFPRKVSTYSIKNTDAIPTVPGPFVTIFDRSGEAPVLVSVPRREVAVETYYPDSDMFNPDWEKKPRLLKYTEAVDDRQVIDGGTIVRSFQGNIGAIYCYIRKIEGEVRNFMETTPVTYTSSKAWCFRVGDGGPTSGSVIVTAPGAKDAAPAKGGDGGLSCTDPSFCPDHPDTVAGFIGRICDDSFTVDNVPEIEAALIDGRLSKAELPWIYNVYGASYGYKFVKVPQLNTFFYGDDSAKWLPPACLRFRNSLASMSGLTKGQWAAFKAIKELRK